MVAIFKTGLKLSSRRARIKDKTKIFFELR